tara:strand:- start:9187 stop:9450 length:264 start_codon:yes stop_codon:yes gene_type:complete
MNYTIELTKTEDMALSYAAASQQDWIDNVVHNRCRIAIDNIIQIAVQKFIEAGENMPGDKDQIVEIAFKRGWVKTGKQANKKKDDII